MPFSTVGKGLAESPIMVLQETVPAPDSAGNDELKEEKSLSSNGRLVLHTQFAHTSHLYLSPRGWPGLSSLNLSPDSRDSWLF